MAVRRESVRIDVDSNLAAVATRDAAAVALLRRELDGIHGHAFFRDSGGTVRVTNNMTQSFTSMERSMSRTSRTASQMDGSINQLTGRLGLLADAVLMLGPGLVPIGAVGVQAIGGLAAAAAAAATAGGSALIAFQGLGDAVSAVQEYQLDPTVQNLEAAQEAMSKLGPDAQRFVAEFQKFRPVLSDIKRAAEAGWFPGLTDSLDGFERLGPKIERIFFRAGQTGGSLVDSAADSLSSERWAPFLKFLEDEVPSAMGSLTRTMGDLAHGLSELFMSMDPGNDRFLKWLEGVADGFDRWATSAEGRDSIQGLLEYARQNGPAVADLFSSLVGALSAIVEAAAPLGGPVLSGLTAVAEVIEAIADSDIATPLIAAVAAMRAFSRLQGIAATTQARFASSLSATATASSSMTAAQAAAAQRYGGQIGAWNPGYSGVRGQGGSGGYSAAMAAALAGPRAQDVARQRAEEAAARRRMIGAGAGVAAGVGFLASGAASELNMTNTAMLTLVGTMAGPWGAAAGAATGAMLDFRANAKATEEALSVFDGVLSSGSNSLANYAAAASQLADTRDNYMSNFEGFGSATKFLGQNPSEAYSLIGDALDGNIDKFSEYAGAAKRADDTTDQIGRNFMRVAQLMGDTTPITAGDLMDPDVDRVQGIIDSLIPALSEMGISLGDVANMTPTELGAFAADLQEMNGQLFDSTNLFKGFTASLAEAMGYLDDRAALRTYKSAIDEATESLKENGRTLDANTPKGRSNAAALDDIAASGLKLAESMPKGAERTAFLRDLRAELERTARGFGASDKWIGRFLGGLRLADASTYSLRQQFKALPKNVRVAIREEGALPSRARAKQLADQLELTAKPRKALLKLATEGEGNIAAAKRLMDSINSKTVTLTQVLVQRGRARAGFPTGPTAADGDTVPKTGLPYADRHPYLLADGEEVISNRFGQADRHRSLLKAINAGMLADGGTTRRGGRRRGGDRESVTYMSSMAQLDDDLEMVSGSLVRFNDGLKRSRKAMLEESERRRDNLRSRKSDFQSYASEVGGSLAAPLVGEGLAGFDLGVAASGNDARRALKALATLKKKGLDGPLFDLVASSGDLALIQEFAALSRADIARRERQYGATQSAQGQLGNYAGQEKYDTTLAAMNREVAALNKEIRRLGKQVRDGARQGTREGTAAGGRKRDRLSNIKVNAGSRAGRG